MDVQAAVNTNIYERSKF